MISNQILQNTIDGIKNISRVDLSILDTDGKVLVSTMSNAEGYDQKEALAFSQSQADASAIGEYQYFKVFEERQLEYVLMIKGGTPDNFLVGRMAVFQIQGLLIAYKERFDKDNFIKNLLLDNLLLVDIYNRAKRLHIDIEKRRIVFILENSPDRDQATLENIRMLFGSKSSDFVTAVDESSIIIVKELEENEDYEYCEHIAKSIIDVVGQDGDNQTHIAFGTIVRELKEVSKSYKEAKMALDVGKIFFADKHIVAYSTLGIGRLIYQLPIPLCKMFIKEIFENRNPDDFDEETIVTINKFFENNLNVSETSRQLFIHRNTLVYRLDKLQKSTGLDLRVFEDAITFKIALMVVRYMKYMETLDY
ncbi:MAG: PucR family transcriptional regulator [Candidatus Alectryocaccobium sp.]|jgi:carbohydrate diacid regulator|nr:helix-turn-helix domain-containing protein [Lachnospiraceae bacterium]MDY6220866.1 helix-turn-helix domain-containing protein [Candidatus Alectryocaccobium sp.]